MFDEVLKRGSWIVDGLSSYKQPAFVYIVPNGELRGGAWVVLDPSINQNGMMEMYADRTARAGVLEPEGIVEIKFRKDKMVAMMDRLDSNYRDIKSRSGDPSITAEQATSLKSELAVREKALWSTYSQIAIHFADLHDTPVRMKAKNTIRDILDWSESRRYFFWRIKRRLAEESALARLAAADSDLSRADRLAILHSATSVDESTDDRSFVATVEKASAKIDAEVTKAQGTQIAASLSKMAKLDMGALRAALANSLGESDVDSLVSLLGRASI